MRLLVLGILLFFVVVRVDAGFLDFLSGITGSKSNSRSKSKSNLKPVTDDSAKKYLSNFGYVNAGNSLAASPGGGFSADLSSAKDILKSAIVKFQEFAGLKKTGQLDEPTKLKMAEPRCGVTDVLAISSNGAAFKWNKNRVTYSIENYTPDVSKDQVRRALREAYSRWSEVTPLQIEEVASDGNIQVRFGANNHGDPWPFDGKGGVLAHATMPENGKLHFDEDENWAYRDAEKIDSNSYTDILAVAIHEGGHTLGLSHSRDENAIMAPFYQKTTDSSGNYVEPRLKSDDIQAIQDIYGAGSGSSSGGGGGSGGWSSGGDVRPEPTTTRRPIPTTTKSSWLDGLFGRSRTTTPSPRFPDSGGSSNGGGSSSGDCPRTVDAFTTSDTGHNYLFSGSKVYELTGRTVSEVYSLRQIFPSSPSYVSAALFNPTSGMTLLFSGGSVYGYYYSRLRKAFSLDMEYPKRLPASIGFNPAGAVRWTNGHQILLSDRDDFAVYDEFWNQITLSNRISSYFPNLPQGVKGALVTSSSVVQALTSSSVYNYDVRTKSVTGQMPLRAWISCR